MTIVVSVLFATAVFGWVIMNADYERRLGDD